MIQTASPKSLPLRFLRWSNGLGVAVIITGALVLAGWQLDNDLLKSLLPGKVAMNPLTALLFICAGTAQLLLVNKGQTPVARKTAYSIAIIVTVTGLLKLSGIIFSMNMPVDSLLFSSKLTGIDGIANHMAPNTAACFMLTGLSLLFINYETPGKKMPANYLCLLVALLGFFSALGYLYRVEAFYKVMTYIPMALHTALCFISLSLSILFSHPDKGLMKVISGPYAGSITIRTLIPVTIIVPVILGLLRLYGYRAGIFTTEFGVTILVSSIILVFHIIIWYYALQLNRRDRQRVKVEEKVRQNALLMENVSEAIIVTDENYLVTAWNRFAQELYGWTEHEAIGLNIRTLLNAIYPMDDEMQVREKFRRERYWQGEVLHHDKSGKQLHVIVTSSAIMDKEGTYTGILAVIRDISATKILESQLRQFNEDLEGQVQSKTAELTGIFERITDAFIALDKDFNYIFLNKKTGEMIHRDPQTLIGKNVWEVFPEAVGSSTYSTFLQAMKDQKYIVSTDYYTPLELWLENHIYPSPEGLSVFIRDISKRKKTELELQTAHDRLAFHIENAPLGFIEWDNQLQVKSWSKSAEEIFGWSEQEFTSLQKNGYSQVYEEDLPRLTEIAGQLISGIIMKNSVKHRNYTRDGRVIWCEWFNSVLKDDQGKVVTILSMVQDITERKKTEDRTRFNARLLNTVGQAVVATNNDGNIIYWNNAAEKTYGWSAQEAIGKSIIEVVPVPEFKKKAVEIMKTLSKGGNWSGEFMVQDKNGRIFPVFITDSPIHDRQGNLTGVIGVSMDISERKKSEETLKSMKEKILEQKIEGQKKISRAIIQGQEEEKNRIGRELHDNINQILAGTRMYLSIAARKDPTTKELVKYPMELIDNSIAEIRLLSHRQVTPLKNIRLEEMTRRLLDNLSQNNPTKLDLAYTATDTLLSDDLKLNIYRIIQEQMNNILKHAGAENVHITISTADKATRITVTDNGRGFNVHDKRNGIGISNMINRVESYNGNLEIISSPGNGCTLSIEIPC